MSLQSFSLLEHSQRDDVGVGVVHGDSDGVFGVLVFGIIVSSSLQEETNQTGKEKRPFKKNLEEELGSKFVT